MKARNRIFTIIGILFVISLCWYFLSTSRSTSYHPSIHKCIRLKRHSDSKFLVQTPCRVHR